MAWQCSKCGKKTANPYNGTCDNGGGGKHNWVNIGRFVKQLFNW
jgi:hypothetical protein